MWHCVVGSVVRDRLMDHSYFIFMDFLTLKIKVPQFLRRLGTTQCHTLEDLNFWLCHYENLRFCCCCAIIISCFFYLSGLTGVLLFVVMIIIFVFAHPIIRKKAYKFFWSTHSLYIVLYILCLVHGLARLTGAPRFWLFFIGPGIIYTLDKVNHSEFYN
jgi:hypothetical protein